ncbi:hypothetical protein C3432_12800 [Citrobacter amalonaticus]|uniref:Uncharacterized protein n=1 Tax=Citrobacter amalonaticus TaxID=35703 RepID=A0A2S4RVI4_CITAM|nr:hypothetical protein [Citrobacter amalonaticus]POT56308.1 hypothetical protein C3432_12800 [Citrobacter amalonaticus]POT74833.1 hypothetical protein C3436_13270 [Citrobacter amalonaticus]POU64362.1 hypothetical protein C3430_14290 [Citrobacter amalonaticus]POV04198.1 hypothetical protein C3424_13610 [Citrobacter amalonaticus]
MSIVNAPIEGAVMIGGTVGNGGMAFSDGFPHVVGKSSPVRIVHCGNYATVYDDVVRAEGDLRAEEDDYIPGEDGIISITGYESKIWAGNMSRSSALGDNSEIELNYMTEPSVPDFDLSGAKAYVAGYASRIIARNYVKSSVLIASGENSLIHDEGCDNTLVCSGNEADVTAGENAMVVVTSNKCSFSFGTGSVAVFCWKDGNDKKVTVVREGEEGISADTPYIFENGNVQVG